MLRLLFKMKRTNKWRNSKQQLKSVKWLNLSTVLHLPEAEVETVDEGEVRPFPMTTERKLILAGNVIKWATLLETAQLRYQRCWMVNKECLAHHVAMCLWMDHLETGINFHKCNDYLHKSQILIPLVRRRVEKPQTSDSENFELFYLSLHHKSEDLTTFKIKVHGTACEMLADTGATESTLRSYTEAFQMSHWGAFGCHERLFRCAFCCYCMPLLNTSQIWLLLEHWFLFSYTRVLWFC